MGLNAKQLRELIVRPALEDMGKWSQAAENLVMGTAAQESRNTFVKQVGGGPALGLFQVEPATFYDYWDGYLTDHDELRKVILRECAIDPRSMFDDRPDPERCIHDLRFAAMMCRVHYLRIRRPLPDANDVWGMAAYWKRYYNTVHGKGTEQEFVDNYRHAQ